MVLEARPADLAASTVLNRLQEVVGKQVLARTPAFIGDPLRRAARQRRHRNAVRQLSLRGLNVDGRIDPGDEMVVPRDPGEYFSIGASALAAIEQSLAEVGMDRPERILDMACGHGRVLRFLRARWPDAAISACDLNRPGVDFCVATFGATGIYSANPITSVAAPSDYDLVWVGSLLTHFDKDRWPEMLTWMRDRLRPGGVLVVSTNGVEVARRITVSDNYYGLGRDGGARVLADHEASGFGYAQTCSDPPYGISLSSKDWVRGAVETVGGLELVSHRDRAWSDHQDMVTLRAV